ncbi:MAG: CPBP family intramembrane metalloprotease [Candidatus Hydrogenedentes bacterium]|nr:CPBP family intramembrane metalloprotease [Candidatus Hydrogenedentota bacterium]
MMEPIPTKRAVKWSILTVFTPLAVSLFAANFYVAAWFMRMAMAGTPHEGPPPFSVIQRGVLLTAGVGLWFTVFLWWFIHRKRASFGELFGTRTGSFFKDVGVGLAVGALWAGIYGAMGWPAFSSMFVFDQAKLASLPATFSAGFCEEWLFRGFVVQMILLAGGSPRSQVLWSSLAFGLAHIMWGPVGMFFTVLLGASFAGLTLWRGNVWSAVVAHTVLNLCIEPGLMEKAMSYANR